LSPYEKLPEKGINNALNLFALAGVSKLLPSTDVGRLKTGVAIIVSLKMLWSAGPRAGAGA
jgi:hypothetical protein